MATGDLRKNFVKIGPAVPEICLQTDRQTDKLIAILRSPIPGIAYNIALKVTGRQDIQPLSSAW